MNLNCRLKDDDGPIEPLLYILYFLPTTINTAWLSVAAGIGIAIVGNVEHTPFPALGAVLLAAAVTVLSKPSPFANVAAKLMHNCLLSICASSYVRGAW